MLKGTLTNEFAFVIGCGSFVVALKYNLYHNRSYSLFFLYFNAPEGQESITLIRFSELSLDKSIQGRGFTLNAADPATHLPACWHISASQYTVISSFLYYFAFPILSLFFLY